MVSLTKRPIVIQDLIDYATYICSDAIAVLTTPMWPITAAKCHSVTPVKSSLHPSNKLGVTLAGDQMHHSY
ncbi:MAG: hypothetical protein F6K30_26970 [Cyanothece sp. SIO2G6]|nr:hypothetical protein [Cyanothece sp. SIO2G6]